MNIFNPQPKFEYLRSEKHLNVIRSLNCAGCDADPRSQAAHSNMGKHGKGRSIKASDEFTLALCRNCHTGYDQAKDKEAADKWFLDLLAIQSSNLLLSGKLSSQAARLLVERGVLRLLH